MIQPDYNQLLITLHPDLKYTPAPSSDSVFAREQSIPLFTRVAGSSAYLSALKLFSESLLQDLIALGSPVTTTLVRFQKSHIEHLELIVHTTAHVASRYPDLKAVAVPRGNGAYVSGQRYGHLSRDRIKRLTSLLTGKDGSVFDGCRVEDAPFVGMRGFRNHQSGDGVVSRLLPQERFLDQLVRAGLVFRGHPFESRQSYDAMASLVTLDGKPVGRDLLAEERVIGWLNERLAKTRVSLDLPDMATFRSGYDFQGARDRIDLYGTQLQRRLKYDEWSGGRLFGHAVQFMPKRLRPHLLFDGEPTCEWDYECSQLHVAYSIVGAQCPPGDAYRIPGYFDGNDRAMFKLCFVAGTGSDEDQNPISAFSHSAHQELGKWLEPGVASRMDRDFWRHHAPIRRFRGSSGWRQLQYEESKIALSVLNQLKSLDIACIPIFDSFVVQRKHEEALKGAMRQAVANLSSPPGIKRNS